MFYYMFIGTPGIVIITGITVTFIFICDLSPNYFSFASCCKYLP